MRLAGPQHGKQYSSQLEANIAKKSVRKSSQVQPTSKDMKQHSTLSSKNQLRSSSNVNVVLNEQFPLKKKRDVPTHLKAMSELTHKETKRLKEQSDLINDNQRELIESSNRDQVAKGDGRTNNDMSKKKKEPLFEEKAKTMEDDGNKDVQGNNTASRLMKKQRCVKGKYDDEGQEGGGNHNPIRVGNDITKSLSQDGHVKVSMVTFVEQQWCCCSKPIDKPNWRYNGCSSIYLKYSCIVSYFTF